MSKLEKILWVLIVLFVFLAAYSYSKTATAATRTIKLYDSIGPVIQYHRIVTMLDSMKEGDRVTIHIASYGGNYVGGLFLANAMARTKAHVTVIVEAPSFSMGAMLACVHDKLIMRPRTFLMFHDGSMGVGGKLNESQKIIKAFQRSMMGFLKDHCKAKGILTDKEMLLIRHGVDVYKHAEDMR